MKNGLLTAVRAALILPISLGILALYAGLGAQTAPRYKFDPEWPKPLPNKWKIGGITGLAVDRNDDVWVLNRPNDLTDIELHAELTPPAADCCVRPPSMIHISKNGDVHRLLRRASGARHGCGQPGLRLHRSGHGPEIRPEDRQSRRARLRARPGDGRRRTSRRPWRRPARSGPRRPRPGRRIPRAWRRHRR